MGISLIIRSESLEAHCHILPLHWSRSGIIYLTFSYCSSNFIISSWNTVNFFKQTFITVWPRHMSGLICCSSLRRRHQAGRGGDFEHKLFFLSCPFFFLPPFFILIYLPPFIHPLNFSLLYFLDTSQNPYSSFLSLTLDTAAADKIFVWNRWRRVLPRGPLTFPTSRPPGVACE